MVPAIQWWKAGTRWPPISTRNTGIVSSAASQASRRSIAISSARRSGASAVRGEAANPALVTACARAAAVAAPSQSVTCARRLARFAVASITPGCAFSTRSTRPVQEAQLIPSTERVSRSCRAG